MRPFAPTLRARLITTSIIGIVALTGLYIYIVLDRVERAQREEVDKLGQALTAQLARSLELPVRAGDRQSVKEIVDDFATRDDIIAVRVTGLGVEYSISRTGAGIEFQRPIRRGQEFSDEVAMLDVAPSAGAGSAGEVTVKMSLDSVERVLLQIRWSLLAAALAVGSGAIVAAFLMARRLTRPLAVLAAEADKIGAGDFGARVDTSGGGAEIQALAANMNRMAESLHQTVARVIQQEKMASLGRMASGITHEMGNPLNSIMLDSSLLSSTLPDGPEKEIATAIRDQARRMKDIVTHLLDYARPAQVDPEPVDLGQVLDEAMLVLAHPLRKSTMTIVRRLPDSLPRVRGMKNMYVQVLVNLVSNSIEATGSGGQLTVTGTVQPQSVLLTMEDNGPGIAAEHLGAIFEPFFTTKREAHGTGIGLSISQQIMSYFNGSIWAESAGERGARICLQFPVWEDPKP